MQKLQTSEHAQLDDTHTRRARAARRSREHVNLDVQNDEDNRDQEIGEAEEEDEQLGEDDEQPGEGQGRYPSRSRARVEHYNPADFEQQHRARRRRAQV